MLLFTAFQFSQSLVYADMPCCVDACPNPDPADPYSCEGGSWCCSGDGCPSQVCENEGCTFNESLWQCCLIDTFDEDTIPSIGSEAECDAISGSYPGGCSWRPNNTCRCTNCQDAACGDIDLSGDSCFNCDESPGCVPAVCE
ncbi:hypothetical protein KAZ57_03855, partial [Patescibacteria group bacterium]|nr:hypothetical protein [Patescibacteria group bacterium]